MFPLCDQPSLSNLFGFKENFKFHSFDDDNLFGMDTDLLVNDVFLENDSYSVKTEASLSQQDNIRILNDAVDGIDVTNTFQEQIKCEGTFSDDASSDTSENGSVGSVDMNHVLLTRNIPTPKLTIKQKQYSRRASTSLYSSDPYIESHRIRLNDRQKNRVKKLNEMFENLNKVLPQGIHCKETRPQSKLGILKRAITYMQTLEDKMQFTKTSEH